MMVTLLMQSCMRTTLPMLASFIEASTLLGLPLGLHIWGSIHLYALRAWAISFGSGPCSASLDRSNGPRGALASSSSDAAPYRCQQGCG